MFATLKQTTCALLLMLGILTMGSAAAQSSVVYHIDNAAMQGLKGLRNIRNHLDVAPTTKIVVVTHAEGVDLLMEGVQLGLCRILLLLVRGQLLIVLLFGLLDLQLALDLDGLGAGLRRRRRIDQLAVLVGLGRVLEELRRVFVFK